MAMVGWGLRCVGRFGQEEAGAMGEVYGGWINRVVCVWGGGEAAPACWQGAQAGAAFEDGGLCAATA
jgi:hypothetical protein